MIPELRERLKLAIDEYTKTQVDRQPDASGFLMTADEWLNKWSAILLGNVPIPMLLYCPKCNGQHIDAAIPGWTNPPHRIHTCTVQARPDEAACGHRWRPSDYYTTGVARLETSGIADGFTQPGGAKATVLQPTEVIALAEKKGIKSAAGHIALNLGARLLLGKTKAGRWTQKNFGDVLTTFEHER
jgi:hypothetical protein